MRRLTRSVNELINFKFDTNLNPKFSETELQVFYSYMPKEKSPALRSFCLRTIVYFGSAYACVQFSPFTVGETDT
jgi:hypothetical protein